jgi:hypothetical protein
MTKSTHSVSVVKDFTAPAVSKVEGVKVTSKIYITFSEELAGTAGGSVTAPTLFKDNVKLGVSSAVLKVDADGKLNTVEVTTAVALEEANYQITVGANSVTDKALAANKNAETKQSFTATIPTSAEDKVKPAVNGTRSVSGDVLTVNYSETVTNSAVDYRNYKIDGNVIPSNSVLYFDTNK